MSGADFQRLCAFDPGTGNELHDVTFADGRFEEWLTLPDGTRNLGSRGTYTVFRDRIEFGEIGLNATFSFRWSFDGTQLVLSDLADDHGDCIAEVVLSGQPWTLVE